jgi:GH24 family phage-related lysozyme (muramidase)
MDPTDFVKKLEGWNPKAYWDKKQWSIGYGTRAAGPNETIDENEGRRRLAAELDQSRGFVSKKYPNLAPHQAAALTSFTYNLGPGWMNSPTRLRAAIDAGDYETASKVMREYNKAGGEVLPGLVKRRDQEAAMFLGGATPMPGAPSSVPSASPSPRPAAPTGAAPAMTPYNGPSPDDVSQSRRMAQMLMQQGTSTEPVGHWTQALARVLQGGVGGMHQAAAMKGQKEGLASSNAGLVQALQGGDPAAAVPGMLANPWSREMGEGIASKVIANRLNPNFGKTGDIQEYEYAVQRGFKGSLQDWMINKKATAGEYSKTPIFGTRTGPDGKPVTVMLQPGARGDAAETRLPEGVSVNSQKPIEVDMGTHTGFLDPITRQLIGSVPKNIAGAKAEAVQGEATGQARVQLPQMEAEVGATLKLADGILGDPEGVAGNFGKMGVLPNMPGGKSANAWAKVQQLKSRAFLDAFSKLRGGGAITEVEGLKAETALLRAQTAQSAEEFMTAVKEFQTQARLGLELKRRQAAGPGAPAAAPPVPATPKQRLRYNAETGELE